MFSLNVKTSWMWTCCQIEVLPLATYGMFMGWTVCFSFKVELQQFSFKDQVYPSWDLFHPAMGFHGRDQIGLKTPWPTATWIEQVWRDGMQGQWVETQEWPNKELVVCFSIVYDFFSLILYIQIFGIAWVFHDRVLDSGWKKACTSTIVFWIHFFTNNLPFFTSIPVHCIEDHWSHAKIWPSSCCIWSLFLGFLNPQMQMDGGPGSLSPRRLSAIIKPKLRQETERHNRSLVSNCGALEGRSNFRIGFFWLAKIPRKRNQMQPNKTPGRPVALHSVCKTSTTSRCTLT